MQQKKSLNLLWYRFEIKGTTFLAYIHVKSRHEEEDPEIKQLKLARMHPRN